MRLQVTMPLLTMALPTMATPIMATPTMVTPTMVTPTMATPTMATPTMATCDMAILATHLRDVAVGDDAHPRPYLPACREQRPPHASVLPQHGHRRPAREDAEPEEVDGVVEAEVERLVKRDLARGRPMAERAAHELVVYVCERPEREEAYQAGAQVAALVHAQ